MDVRGMSIAVVGGDERAERIIADRAPRGTQVDCYQSSRFGGNGQQSKLRNALAAGRYNLVVLLTRWMGHSMSETVRAEARCKVVYWPQGMGELVKALKAGRIE